MRLGAVLVVAALLAAFGLWRRLAPEPASPPPPDCPAVAALVDARGERLVCADTLAHCGDVTGERVSGCERLGPVRGAVLSLRGLPIDLNRASPDDLRALPGVGPGVARRIVEARGPGGFCGPEALERVPGLGPKRVESLAPFVTFAGRACVADSPQ